MVKNMALVLQFLIAVIFIISVSFGINLATAYYLNISNDNSTNANATSLNNIHLTYP